MIVAETAHKNNWKEEIKKWKLQECNIDIQCYASLKKYKDSNWDVVIFDEAHHLKSSLRLGIISTIKSTYTIFLSATLGFNLRCDLAYIYGNIYNSRCSIDDAIKNEILPTPKIYLIPLELDDTKSNCVIEEYKGRTFKVKDKVNGYYKEIKINDISICREADAALYWKLKDSDTLERPVGIVNIGFRSTELAYFDKSLTFIDKKSDTIEFGNRSVMNNVKDKLLNKGIIKDVNEIDTSDDYNELKEKGLR